MNNLYNNGKLIKHFQLKLEGNLIIANNKKIFLKKYLKI